MSCGFILHLSNAARAASTLIVAVSWSTAGTDLVRIRGDLLGVHNRGRLVGGTCGTPFGFARISR